MTDATRHADIETLARMAARLAGRDPAARITVKLGNTIAFDDLAWRYPDFLERAEQAYMILERPGRAPPGAEPTS